ncbi:hypothetical protein P4E94_17320 [Pontiellaceae bacterium B12219]|nr:hypothetical protein [Pontiellaceae bacterium B12219]
MNRSILIFIATLFYSVVCYGSPTLSTQPLGTLEEELVAIDTELAQLAAITLRQGIGSVGYRSPTFQNRDNPAWIRIDLENEMLIDQIVLAPILLSDPETGVHGEGFPKALRVLAGTGNTTNVVATLTENDRIVPRIAPLAISFPPVKASWVTLEVTLLGTRIIDDLYMIQLSEIMVFSGLDNVALNKPVSLPAHMSHTQAGHHYRYLVDGFTPYQMDTAEKTRSFTRLMLITDMDTPPSLTIDLQEPCPVNQINLHTANVIYSIPMSQFSNKAVPRHILIQGANRANFSDASVLCEHHQKSMYDTGPIISLRFPEKKCRYVRINVLNPNSVTSENTKNRRIAFSEIEVLSYGQNAALHAPVKASANLTASKDILKQITDGINFYGEILPIRDWMNQLSRRHDLEIERPRIQAELNRRYALQKVKLRRMKSLIYLLLISIGFGILTERMLRIRQAAQIRERFAADLHDELGATNHAIGILSDAVSQADESPEERKMLLQRIRMMTERNGRSIRNFSDWANSESLFSNLAEDIKRSANRITANLEHEIIIEGEHYLSRLPGRVRIDLFLFFKESLINICRHSHASAFKTHLIATPKMVTLSISDNGKGLSGGQVPPSLKRRAKLLKAKIYLSEAPNGGTHITLKLNTHRWIHRLKFKSHSSRSSLS